MDLSFIKKLFDPGSPLGILLLAILVTVATWLTAWITSRLIRKSQWVIEKFHMTLDQTALRMVIRIKNLVLLTVGIILFVSLIPALRTLLGTLLAGAGVTAIVVGFAARSTLSNLLSGFTLAVFRPFRINDTVTIDEHYGVVEDITLRHTVIRTWEHKRVIIPNEKIDNTTVVNYDIVNRGILCRIETGVSYDSDIDRVREVTLEVARQCPHRDTAEKDPWMRVISHGDFSIGIRIYMLVGNIEDHWAARFWMLEHLKKRFDKEGIEIPFPYRTLVYKKDLPPPRRNKPAQKT